MATAQAILAQRDVTAPWFSAVRPRGCEVAARRWDRKEDGRLPGFPVFRLPPASPSSPTTLCPGTSKAHYFVLTLLKIPGDFTLLDTEEDGSEEASRGEEGKLEEEQYLSPSSSQRGESVGQPSHGPVGKPRSHRHPDR